MAIVVEGMDEILAELRRIREAGQAETVALRPEWTEEQVESMATALQSAMMETTFAEAAAKIAMQKDLELGSSLGHAWTPVLFRMARAALDHIGYLERGKQCPTT